MQKNQHIVFAVFIVIAGMAASLALLSLKAALLVCCGLILGLVVFFKPFYGLLLYIILLYVRPQDFIPELARFRVVLVLATLILAVFFIHKILRKEKIHIFTSRQHILMFFLLLIVPASHLANLEVTGAWESFNEFLTLFLLFFIIVNLTDNFDKFRKICWVLVICTTLVAVNGIIQHFKGVDLIGNTPIVGRIRWIGLFGDPNDLALLFDSFLPFLLVNLFEKDTKLPSKAVLSLAMLLIVAALYFTNSRGGFVALMAVLAYFSWRKWGLIRGIALGFIFLVATFVLAPSRMGNISPYEASAGARIDAWTHGLSLLIRHPVLGVGFRNFSYHHGTAPHSAFIECVVDLGLIGYFVWLGLIYSCFTGLMRVERYMKQSPYNRYSKILQLSLVGFAGSAFFLSQAYNPVLYILIALSSLTINSDREMPVQTKLMSARDIWTIIALVFGSIIAFKLLAMVYY